MATARRRSRNRSTTSRASIDIKNQADNLVFQTEKQLKEFGDKVSGDARSKIENAKEQLKDAVKSNNVNSMKTAIDTLNAAWNEASTQMYQQATAAGAQPGAGPQQGPPESGAKKDEKKVEDAQYEVVDDKNKKS